MEKKPKISFKHVSKAYDLFQNKSDSIKSLFKIGRKKIPTFWALKDVSFTIYEGETVGLIGVNGSGKSTVSSIISGAAPASEGEVQINGKASLIAINVGFKGPLTGLENIRLKCLMHGLNTKEIEQLLPKIIDFADIGDFINQPVKNYSSGMKSRLGFAVSVHIEPDILVIDEALSVGDQTFYQKCVDKIEEFKTRGKTIVFVSHSLNQVKNLCDRIIWMHYGEVREVGKSQGVAVLYDEFVKWFNAQPREFKKKYQVDKKEAQKKPPKIRAENQMLHRYNLSLISKIMLVGLIGCIILFGTLVATDKSLLSLF